MRRLIVPVLVLLLEMRGSSWVSSSSVASAENRSVTGKPAAAPPFATYRPPIVRTPAWLDKTWTVDAHEMGSQSHVSHGRATDGIEVKMPEGTAWRCIVQPISVEAILRRGQQVMAGQTPTMWYVHRSLLCSPDGWRHHAEMMATVILDAKTGRAMSATDQTEMYLGGDQRLAIVLKNPWQER